MKFVTGKRGSGKTRKLIELSVETGYPIVTSSEVSAKYIKELAQQMGVEVPYVYTERQAREGRIMGFDRRAVLIDNAESLIEDALNSYLSVPVKAVSITTA